MKKFLLGIVIILIIALVAGFLFAGSLLSSAVETGVNKIGPQLTQTRVELDSASVSPFSGSGSLSGLFVGNPEGFKAEKAFSLGQVDLDIDISSVLGGEAIVIERVYITEPEIVMEKKLSGSNLQTILDNIKEATGGTQEEQPQEEGEPTKVIIESFVMENAKVTTVVAGKSIAVPVPRMEFTDLGKEKGGATPAELSAEIMGQILGGVTKAIAENASAIAEGAVETGEKAVEKGKEAVEGIGEQGKEAADKIKGLFD